MAEHAGATTESAANLEKKLNQASAARQAEELYPQWDFKRLLFSVTVIVIVLAAAIYFS